MTPVVGDELYDDARTVDQRRSLHEFGEADRLSIGQER